MATPNRSTEETCGKMYPGTDQVYRVTFQVVFPILIAMGVISNVVNIIVLTRPRMMNRIYRWLRTLAVVDIALCLLTIPVCLSNSGHNPTGYILARYYSYFGWSLSIGSQIVSFYLMAWFAYDRYLAVCRHEKYPKSLRYEKYRKRVVCTVAFVVILYAPTMVVGRVCEKGVGWMPLDGYRNIDNFWYKAYSWVREIFSRVVPVTLITLFTVKITMRLKQLRSIRDGFASGVTPSRREKERKLVVLLFWVTLLFYVYNTPVIIYYLVFLNHNVVPPGKEEQVITFGVISNLIQMVGNVSNFTLYFFINPEFRRTIRDLCCRNKEDRLDASEGTGGSQVNNWGSRHQSRSATLCSVSFSNSIDNAGESRFPGCSQGTVGSPN